MVTRIMFFYLSFVFCKVSPYFSLLCFALCVCVCVCVCACVCVRTHVCVCVCDTEPRAWLASEHASVPLAAGQREPPAAPLPAGALHRASCPQGARPHHQAC